jgi:hypothetical protein
MKQATISAGVITGIFSGPQSFPTSPVPDHVGIGWENVGGNWQKSAALLAKEQEDTDDANEAAVIKQAIAALRNGTGTAAERLTRIERALAWILKRSL